MKVMRAQQTAALERLEVEIYEAEPRFLRALANIGAALTRDRARSEPPVPGDKVTCTVVENDAPQSSGGTGGAPTPKRRPEPSRPETFLAVKRSELQHKAMLSRAPETRDLYVEVVPPVPEHDDPSPNSVFTPLYFPHTDVPLEADRFVTLSSSTALAAVERNQRFLLSNANPDVAHKAGDAPFSPFAVYERSRGLVRQSGLHASQTGSSSAKRPTLKRKAEDV